MPRYFFHIPTRGVSDAQGQEFPDHDTAQEEAMVVARELARHKHLLELEYILVTDEDGNIISEVPLIPE
ncbi:MAG TPA: hypothetical protein VFP60_19655 [Pseudolabrys sp.]|nr:hypothetical protein [Pseudolabrys sp.]